jgi:hypothetical protein
VVALENITKTFFYIVNFESVYVHIFI